MPEKRQQQEMIVSLPRGRPFIEYIMNDPYYVHKEQ